MSGNSRNITVNRIFDKLVALAREDDRTKWAKGEAEITKELREMKARPAGDKELEVLFDPTAKGQAVGNIFVSLLTPAYNKVIDARDRQRQTFDNTRIAFALTWYRRVHERYPPTLDALTPHYLKQIPRDRFSGQSLRYDPLPNGFLLYSVGINGIDDEGRGFDSNPPGDDLPIQIPITNPRR